MSDRMSRISIWYRDLYRQKDLLWLLIWLGGLMTIWFWDALFLNAPAFARVQTAFLNSLITGLMVVALSVVLGWIMGVGMHLLERGESKGMYIVAQFITNLLRSVPQILVVLIGYVILTVMLDQEIIRSSFAQLLWIAGTITLAVFLEAADTVRSRIEHFRSSDMVDAMLCCGISEWRIINVEILWRNSRSHLLHKTIALFGVSIFLQCSIDFIISVGLSTDVSLSNFPLTLGSLLASLESKQDILSISNLLSDPGYLPVIFVRHLQGVSIAFSIVFTLLCLYKIANGFVWRHRLA
ncbi:MAG: hypothetical protein V1799_05400 [bacterium]